ncbi:hypothetical protein N8I84_13010 [Streptomyces cynarae]|uniref:Uncharacterized protein n=1 Tax=Streptomyces cynarae TaxID=2981134 RepID=A0ABY6DYU3_9ACTN|nr:hypothetical protein [Streptomyces cynarae]UXY19546.1 hypothetical protein N8I84_13010 [Streptomyces cynarae]
MTEWTPGGAAERPEATGRRPDTGEPRSAAEFRPETGERRSGAEFRPEAGESRVAGEYRPGTGEPRPAAEFRPDTGESRPSAAGSSREPRLLPRDECDKFELRLQHAVGRFVDRPKEAVEEADQVVQEVASRLAEAVSSRRRTLKASWQETGDTAHPTGDTEQLRLALRDYRATAERLLNM